MGSDSRIRFRQSTRAFKFDQMSDKKTLRKNMYIDLFSGCGGLSLGLGKAGWTGLFSVEKDPMAFETFKKNLIDEGRYAHFEWPHWLPQKAANIEKIIKKYSSQLYELRGKVDLIAGGPPCQGFSMAGLRNPNDPRNKLSKQYIKMVEIIKPKFVLIENVKGFNTAFKSPNLNAQRRNEIGSLVPYSEIVGELLQDLGYRIYCDTVACERFGVPQKRSRFIMIGVLAELSEDGLSPFLLLEDLRKPFLLSKRLPLRAVTVKEAIGDLEVIKPDASLIHHSGSFRTGFKQLDYRPASPSKQNSYVSLMRSGLSKADKPNSLRLARHNENTVKKFKIIQKTGRAGIILSPSEKKLLGIKKQAICYLDPNKPSKTITTLPDDILHYKEPRILTVRENARIQSFPDDFVFCGKYTTGGKERTKECPRYTQVGNAVPPLLGEALGILIERMKQKFQEPQNAHTIVKCS